MLICIVQKECERSFRYQVVVLWYFNLSKKEIRGEWRHSKQAENLLGATAHPERR